MSIDEGIRAGRSGGSLWWQRGAPLAFVSLFVAVASVLALLRHAAFNTGLLDLGYYTQVIWNTSQGRWFADSLKFGCFLADHFSPILAVLAPLFWIAPDARTLLIVGIIALALAIAPAYSVLKSQHPHLVPLLVLAFVLNPLLHQAASQEFHEIMLAVPTLALAMYALYANNLKLLFIALGLTLLVREDMGIYVASFGLYILFFRPRTRWIGIAAIMVGMFWLLVLTGFVMPALGGAEYAHGSQFGQYGESTSQILSSLVRDPSALLSSLFTAEKAVTLLTLFLPLAFVPWLARGEQLLWIPPLLVLLLSASSFVSHLHGWHVVPLLPLLWGTTAATLGRFPRNYATIGVAALLLANVGAWLVWSPFPGGGGHDPNLHTVTPHHAIGSTVLDRIPRESSVATQSGLGAHLGTREQLWLFPWLARNDVPEVIVLDATGHNSYPLSQSEVADSVLRLQMDPGVRVSWEQDEYYIFETNPSQYGSSWSRQGLTWEPWLRLEGYELAQTDEQGAFMQHPVFPIPGHTLRAELYFRALQVMDTNYSVSVRLVAPDGRLIAQDDSWPARGMMPTTLWNSGRVLRDTHYLHVPLEGLPEAVEIVIVIYDSATMEAIGPTSGHSLTTLRQD